MNQRICKQCNTWNNASNKFCVSCGNSIDENAIREEEKKKKITQKELADRLRQQPDWLLNFFEKLKTSGNPFKLALYHVAHTLWMVYFSILLFIVWLVFIVAG